MARVVLTQPLPRVEALERALAQRGHEVTRLTFTRIQARPMVGLAAQVAEVDWVVAVSPAAVEALASSLNCVWPSGPGLALVGPGSLLALEQTGLRVPADRLTFPATAPFDAGAMLAAGPLATPAGCRVLVVRGDGGRDDWIDVLRARGAHVEVLSLYDRQPIAPQPEARARLGQWLAESAPVYCVLTQSSAAVALAALPEAERLREPTNPLVALAIHARIAEAARTAGFHRVQLIDPGENAIAAAIECGAVT